MMYKILLCTFEAIDFTIILSYSECKSDKNWIFYVMLNFSHLTANGGACKELTRQSQLVGQTVKNE